MKDYDTSVTAEWLRENFSYEKFSGRFTRLWPVIGYRGGVMYPAGTLTGCLHKDGYRYMAISKRLFLEHRLAWLYVTGEWPACQVDHVDGNRSNNAWYNLRASTVQQNRMNSLGQKSRTNPYPGVYRTHKGNGRFAAQIKKDGEVMYIGVFDTAEDAYVARKSAEIELFGAYAGHLRDSL
jgi:mRNA-degrading endonuclease RelE of RelBE toxin-antitoxin system